MPLYRCTAPVGAISQDAKAELAEAVMRIHCDVTGAPETFVHVFYFDDASADTVQLNGSIRSGRTDEQKTEMRTRFAEAISTIGGVDPSKVSVRTMDIPAKWVMEGGTLLPEPGEEAEWLAQHGAH
jgi:phenylpyruvate tautomerase PptA (4-oxalocrotonate tautomerase family)